MFHNFRKNHIKIHIFRYNKIELNKVININKYIKVFFYSLYYNKKFF